MARVAMLTTVDNPYDPFNDFRAWFTFDTLHGYHSTNLLGRIAITTDEMSESDVNLATEQAIDEIVQENVTGMFKKVIKES